MKTISKEGEVLRVDDATAEAKVRAGWNYVPKSEYKKIRDFEKIAKETEEAKRKAIAEGKAIITAVQKPYKKGQKNKEHKSK